MPGPQLNQLPPLLLPATGTLPTNGGPLAKLLMLYYCRWTKTSADTQDLAIFQKPSPVISTKNAHQILPQVLPLHFGQMSKGKNSGQKERLLLPIVNS